MVGSTGRPKRPIGCEPTTALAGTTVAAPRFTAFPILTGPLIGALPTLFTLTWRR
jgi:hypothetical protein